jgi:CheY-like chemotaxis protein/nitrogen-specific signal transduction histidine kinase
VSDRYHQLFLNFSDAVFIEDPDGMIVDANIAATRLLDRPLSEIVGSHQKTILSPITYERLVPQRRALKSFQRLQIDGQMVGGGGKITNVILDVSLVPWMDSVFDEVGTTDPQPTSRYLVVARESLKLDELEREIRLQRQSAAQQFGSIPRATFFISSRNETSSYPPPAPGEAARPLEWVRLLLLTPAFKPYLDRAWAGEEASPPPAWYSPPRSYLEELGCLENVNPYWEAASKKHATPPQRWLKLTFLPLRVRGLEISDVCVNVLDLTNDRLDREQQRRSEQRVASALLSSTYHHELNNYLSVILAQASALRLSLPPGQLPPPNLGAVIDAAQNAAGFLRRWSDLSLQGEGVLEEININALVADCANLLPLLVHGRINIDVELAPDVPLLRGDHYALRAMLLAIGHHAELSMPRGTVLSIKTYRSKVNYPGLPPSAGISIQDNVTPGMRGAIANTPSAGHGGESLEITLARAVLRAHRGQLEFTASSTQGGIWDIILPGIEDRPVLTPEESLRGKALPDEDVVSSKLSDSAQQANSSIVELPPPPIASNGAVKHFKVLLADDEENFRAFTSWVLKERGFEVLTANDGQEAFERFQEAPETFHLVILDAYMPRMGGLETYLRMQVLRPDLPVLFASGFVRGPSVNALVDGCPGPAGVLLKPFSSEDLLVAVKKALTPAESV